MANIIAGEPMKSVGVVIPADLLYWLDNEAHRKFLSRSTLIRILLMEAVERSKPALTNHSA